MCSLNLALKLITKQQAQRIRIKNEIKFLYKKNQQINKEFYVNHLYNVNHWQNIWIHIEQNINTKLRLEIETKIKNQNKKIHNIKKIAIQQIAI
jgi:predicted RND superfamily exporter protein